MPAGVAAILPAQPVFEPGRVWMHDHVHEVPALLAGGADDGAHGEVVPGAAGGAEAAEDFLHPFHEPEIGLCLVVRKRHGIAPTAIC